MEIVQTRTMTIYTEARVNRKMGQNGVKMHLPKARTHDL
jgi:hypothetical protein